MGVYTMASVKISTTVEYSQHQLVQTNKWRWSDLIKEGITARVNNTEGHTLHDKIQIMEKQIEALKKSNAWQKTLLPKKTQAELSKL